LLSRTCFKNITFLARSSALCRIRVNLERLILGYYSFLTVQPGAVPLAFSLELRDSDFPPQLSQRLTRARWWIGRNTRPGPYERWLCFCPWPSLRRWWLLWLRWFLWLLCWLCFCPWPSLWRLRWFLWLLWLLWLFWLLLHPLHRGACPLVIALIGRGSLRLPFRRWEAWSPTLGCGRCLDGIWGPSRLSNLFSDLNRLVHLLKVIIFYYSRPPYTMLMAKDQSIWCMSTRLP
jgi:hypothetical protein